MLLSNGALVKREGQWVEMRNLNDWPKKGIVLLVAKSGPAYIL